MGEAVMPEKVTANKGTTNIQAKSVFFIWHVPKRLDC